MNLSEHFFEEEELGGFKVTGVMKRAWAAELELLQILTDICEKHNLEYFADWGTLLGAVRHKGFVPWDDDIDLCMKRVHYNKLIQILPLELPKGIAVTGIHSGEEGNAILGNSTPQLSITAMWSLWDSKGEYMRFLHGYPFPYVGIDIFPLDTVPRDSELASTLRMLISVASGIGMTWGILEKQGDLEEKLIQLEELSGVPIPRDVSIEMKRVYVWRLADQLSGLCKENEGDELTEYCFYCNNEKYIMQKNWYDNKVMLPFQNTQIAVPSGFDKILTVKYGDYRRPVKNTGGHSYPFYADMEKQLKNILAEKGVSEELNVICRKIATGEKDFFW